MPERRMKLKRAPEIGLHPKEKRKKVLNVVLTGFMCYQDKKNSLLFMV